MKLEMTCELLDTGGGEPTYVVTSMTRKAETEEEELASSLPVRLYGADTMLMIMSVDSHGFLKPIPASPH
jgi:hypothetical protein